MTDTLIDPLPPLKPHERHPVLETDVFCQTCGYNLRSQPVTRDDRLGIFICRCPECGRFHAAGTGVTAASLWTARIATSLLVIWVLVVLSALFWIVIGLGAIAVGHTETFSYRRLETLDGQPAEYKEVSVAGGGTSWTPVKRGTTQPGKKPIRAPSQGTWH